MAVSDLLTSARAPEPGAELRLVSVVFADIAASSSLVSGRDPEEADADLQSVLSVFISEVRRFGGLVAQVMGDGVMGVFGSPVTLEDHAERACLAAQAIIGAMAQPRPGLTTCAVRIGVASGDVVLRRVADAERHDYRVVGECVHLAAKLQQMAGPNTVLVSATTARLTYDSAIVRYAGSLRLAAGAARKPAYRLLDAAGGHVGRLRVPSPFVGRRTERARLDAAWRSARDGAGGAVLIRGEPGFGRTALLADFLARIGGAGCAEILCWSLPDPSRPHRLSSELELAPVAASLSGIIPYSERASDTGLLEAVLALSRRTPVVVAVDDAHFAGPAMARFLTCLQRSAASARILIAATRRRDSDDGWWGDGGGLREVIDLAPLARRDMEGYLDARFGTAPSLNALRRELIDRSQGCPLYLAELTRFAVERGALFGATSALSAASGCEPTALPMKIRARISARIDVLDEESRQILLLAAVLGTAFDFGALRLIAEKPADALASALGRLAEAGLVEPSRARPGLSWRFRYDLVRDVAYHTLTLADRRRMHAQAFAAYRTDAGRRLPDRLPLLLHHACLSENPPAAYALARAAGRRAERSRDRDDAIRHYELAAFALDHMNMTTRNQQRRAALRAAQDRSRELRVTAPGQTGCVPTLCEPAGAMPRLLALAGGWRWLAGLGSRLTAATVSRVPPATPLRRG